MKKDLMMILNKWREMQYTVTGIDLEDVIISHPIHLDTDFINFNGNMNKLGCYKDGREIPIIVRDLGNEKYQLLFGLKQLIKAKILNLKTLEIVVVKETREELISRVIKEKKQYDLRWQYIDSIKILAQFSNSTPSSDKLINKRDEIEKGIIPAIEIDSKNGALLDGYITYLVLKQIGVYRVLVKIKK